MVLKCISILTLCFSTMVVATIDDSFVLSMEKYKDYREAIQKIDSRLLLEKLPIDSLKEGSDFDENVQKILFIRIQLFLNCVERGECKFLKREVLIMKNVLELSDEFDLEDYDFDQLRDKFEDLYKRWTHKLFYKRYYLHLSYVTWNYSLKLIDETGTEAQLYSKEKGWCLGGGIRYENMLWGGSADLCYAYMAATVGEDSRTIKYNQNNVVVDAFTLRPNIFWKPKERVLLKLSLPLVLHFANFKAPADSRIVDDNKITYGYLIGGEWQLSNRVSIDLNFGRLKNYPSSIWLIGSSYFF